MVVFAFGVGTPQGAPVPIPGANGELKRDAEGNVGGQPAPRGVLEKLARATGGAYLRATSAAADPAPILQQIDRMEKRTIESQSLSTLEERFQWPLALAALALLALPGGGAVRAGSPPRPSSPAPSLPPSPGEEGEKSGKGRRPSPNRGRPRAVPARLLLGALALPSLGPALAALAAAPAGLGRALDVQPPGADGAVDRGLQSGQAPGGGGAGGHGAAAGAGRSHGPVRRRHGPPRAPATRGRRCRCWRRRPRGPRREAVAGRPLQPGQRAPGGRRRRRRGGGLQAGAARAAGEPDAKYNLELALREEQKQKMGGRGKAAGLARQPLAEPGPLEPAGEGEQPAAATRRRRGTSRPTAQQQGQQPQPGQAGTSRSRARGRTTACRSSATSRT